MNGTLKIIGVIMGILVLIGGWVYAGIMSGYTHRIKLAEDKNNTQDMEIGELKLFRARTEEQYKAIIEKLDALIEKHK